MVKGIKQMLTFKEYKLFLLTSTINQHSYKACMFLYFEKTKGTCKLTISMHLHYLLNAYRFRTAKIHPVRQAICAGMDKFHCSKIYEVNLPPPPPLFS